jgi:hypothetical protein
MSKKQRLEHIAKIIEAVDERRLASDGAVTETLDEMTQEEISEIYRLASDSHKSGSIKIFTDKPMNPTEAIDYMTDEWIDKNQYCIQTVKDLRDCLKIYIKRRSIGCKHEKECVDPIGCHTGCADFEPTSEEG